MLMWPSQSSHHFLLQCVVICGTNLSLLVKCSSAVMSLVTFLNIFAVHCSADGKLLWTSIPLLLTSVNNVVWPSTKSLYSLKYKFVFIPQMTHLSNDKPMCDCFPHNTLTRFVRMSNYYDTSTRCYQIGDFYHPNCTSRLAVNYIQ